MMTAGRFAIDAPTALRLIREAPDAHRHHQLVAPSILRSHVLSTLYREVQSGQLDEAEGRRQLEALAEMKIRLLGDRVSRATAWKLAARLGWSDTDLAEYLAVASLQADALVADDARLTAGAAGIVPVTAFSSLSGPA